MKVVITLHRVRTISPEPKALKPALLNKEKQGEESVRYSAMIRPGQVELLMKRLEAKIKHYQPDEVEITMGAPKNHFHSAYFADFNGLSKELRSVASSLLISLNDNLPGKSIIGLKYD